MTGDATLVYFLIGVAYVSNLSGYLAAVQRSGSCRN